MPKSMTSITCSRTSHHPEDVRQGYGGRCHAFTEDCSAPGRCTATPTTIAGNIAFCDEHARIMGLDDRRDPFMPIILTVSVVAALIAVGIFIWMLTW